jgi:hypothetical protein
MSFLGYDPGALTELSADLTRAAQQLSEVGSTEGIGDHPDRRRHLAEAIATVEHWAGRVRAIAVCDVMERQQPVTLDTANDLSVLQRAMVQGWSAAGLAVVHLDDGPHLGLDGAALGKVVVDALHQWEQGPWWVTAGHSPLTTVDHLLEAIVGDSDALATVWEHRHASLGVMLYGANDMDRVAAVLRAWTDPAQVDLPTAAARVTAVVQYVRAIPHATAEDLEGLRTRLVLNPGYGESPEVRWWALRRALADVVAPWQMWLVTGHHDWGASSAQGLDTLTWLLESPESASVLAQHLGPAVTSRAMALGDDVTQRRDTIERMAWSIGAVDALVQLSDEADVAGTHLVRSLVALSLGHAAGAAASAATAAIVPPLAGVARTLSSGQVNRALGPDDDTGDRDRARLASLDRRAAAASGLMAVIAHDHRARGWLSGEVPPPPAPVPRDTHDPATPDALAAWLAHLDTLDDHQIHPSARAELHQVWHAVTPTHRRAAVDRGREFISG